LAARSYTVSGTTYTTDGSQRDVQSAVRAVPDGRGAVVIIPNGSYVWTGQLTITKSLTLQGQTVGGVTITNDNPTTSMIVVNGSAKGHTIIEYINFVLAVANSNYLFTLDLNRNISSNYTALVHDCKFNNSTVYSWIVVCRANGIIFWNDSFVGSGNNGLGGISFVCQRYGPISSWNTPDSIGTRDTTGLMNSYVENCTFYDGPTGCSNFDDNSRVVWRYNKMINASLGSHGQETSIYGVRHWEVYNNTFIYSSSGKGPSGASYPLNMNYWFEIRGGTGVVTRNAMDDIPFNKTGVQLNVFSINRLDSIPCQTAYPAARQIGIGWSASSRKPYGSPIVPQDGVGQVSDPVYIWNNSGTETADPNYVGLNQYAPDDCANGERIETFLKQSRDYFVNVAKPEWRPYTYPHPLHAAFASRE
jgi:hypothetical protein